MSKALKKFEAENRFLTKTFVFQTLKKILRNDNKTYKFAIKILGKPKNYSFKRILSDIFSYSHFPNIRL